MDKCHTNGNMTMTAGGTIAKGNLLKFSSGKVIATTADTDAAIGVALDSAANGDFVPVALLGVYNGTVVIKASGAISQGGAVNALGGAGQTGDFIVGRALEAATASGDMIECVHCVSGYKDLDTNT